MAKMKRQPPFEQGWSLYVCDEQRVHQRKAQEEGGGMSQRKVKDRGGLKHTKTSPHYASDLSEITKNNTNDKV